MSENNTNTSEGVEIQPQVLPAGYPSEVHTETITRGAGLTLTENKSEQFNT